VTSVAGAPQADARQPAAGSPAHRVWRTWRRSLAWATTAAIDLEREPADHGLRNARAAVAAAGGVGALYGAKEWQVNPQSPFLVRYLVADALVAFVLTPLIVSVYLALPELVTRLLQWLRRDAIIDPAAAGKRLDQFAKDLRRQLGRVWKVTALLTALYLAYALREAHVTVILSLATLVVVVSLIAQAALFYLGVVAVAWMWQASQAVGKLLRSHRDQRIPDDFPIRVQPLHPDGCGGLWVVGHMLTLVLDAAAILAGAGVGISLALYGTAVAPTRRPELYLLGLFYVLLLPSALLNLLWHPHQLMDQRRDEILMPVAKGFDARIATTRPSPADNAAWLKAKTDSLSELARQLRLLDEACPTWPLRTRRLQRVAATAILPVVVSVMTAVLSKILTG
jgi:hypothetical protein